MPLREGTFDTFEQQQQQKYVNKGHNLNKKWQKLYINCPKFLLVIIVKHIRNEI